MNNIPYFRIKPIFVAMASTYNDCDDDTDHINERDKFTTRHTKQSLVLSKP